MPNQSVLPIIDGIDHLSPDTNLAKSTVRDAKNVDIAKDGSFARRQGFQLLVASSQLHSMFSSGDAAYVCDGSMLCKFVAPSTLIPMLQLPSADPVAFTHKDGVVYFCQLDCVGIIESGVARFIGVPNAGFTGAVSSPVGGLSEGRYGVAIAYCDADKQEGALGPVSFLNLAEGEGIRLTVASRPDGAEFTRVYRTDANGETLYLCSEFPAAMTTYLVGRSPLGRQATTRGTRRTLGGTMIRHWKGRCLVARDNILRFSLPMQPGLENAQYGFVQFPERITFIEGVEGGVFVGFPGGVSFLAGTNPDDWELRRASDIAPVPGTSILVDANNLSGKLELTGVVAAWLSSAGYAIGTLDGAVLMPQGKRIIIPSVSNGVSCVNKRRVVTFTL